MSDGPKLYVNKPKKAQVKQFQQSKAKEMPSSASTGSASSGSAAAASYSSGGGAAPVNPPKESFVRRYRFLWPLLLAVNFSVGAYLFMRTKKKDVDIAIEEETSGGPSPQSLSSDASAPVAIDKASVPLAVHDPLRPRDPIPEKEQRELFKWLLEEKRKIKPKDAEEKKRIDEEKAILKQFIRAKSIPPL